MSDLKQTLTRGVIELIDSAKLRAKLNTDPTKVIIKFGVDPTSPDLHLGHAVCLRKLREFQDLGCKVVFLIGDFTARIGDPTGKSKLRPELEQKEVEQNVKTYLEQAGKILSLDPRRFAWIRNSDWFVSIHDVLAPAGSQLTLTVQDQKLVSPPLPANHIMAKTQLWLKSRMQKKRIKHYSLINLFATLRHLTHAHLLEREMFQKRLKDSKPIHLHELIYPIIQGIDSSALYEIFGSCDLELGGNDQHFNMLMGREIMQINQKEPQAVLTMPILTGIDGQQKMSKTLGNQIGITESPREIFGRTMRIPDELILPWIELATNLDLPSFKARFQTGENPRNLKIELARELVRLYHSPSASLQAEAEFKTMFAAKAKGAPTEIPLVQIEAGQWNIIELMSVAKLVQSKSEARSLIKQNGVRVNTKPIASLEANFTVNATELLLQVGKRRWAKIVGF